MSELRLNSLPKEVTKEVVEVYQSFLFPLFYYLLFKFRCKQNVNFDPNVITQLTSVIFRSFNPNGIYFSAAKTELTVLLLPTSTISLVTADLDGQADTATKTWTNALLVNLVAMAQLATTPMAPISVPALLVMRVATV